MGDMHGDKPKSQPRNPRNIALLGAGAVGLAIINMSTGSEAPSHAVAILQYAALGGGLLALVGGLIMMAAQQK